MNLSHRSIATALLLASSMLLGTALPACAAPDPCAGIPHCQNLGPFTATVLKVNVTRQDRTTAYQGVRTTVRFTNISRNPIVLAYRDHSSQVTDNKGLSYRWSAKAYGIGLVTRDSADPQFQLAPGESREAGFDGVLQYSMRSQVAGNVFQHDITIVQLVPQGGQRVREARDHAISFSGLTATSGYAGAAPPMPERSDTPAVAMTPSGTPAATPAPAFAPAPSAMGGEGCAGAPACQAQGPLVATVVRVNVTDNGNVTAYHGVRTTVRFKNVSDRPLILGYRSGVVTDNNGLVYRWSSKAAGIGVVTNGSADPQFQLAPGESREAAFEGVLQYSRRGNPPGNVFQHDLTIAQLEIVGPQQVRTRHEYALSFTDLRASGGVGGTSGATGDARSPVEAMNNVVNAIKKLNK